MCSSCISICVFSREKQMPYLTEESPRLCLPTAIAWQGHTLSAVMYAICRRSSRNGALCVFYGLYSSNTRLLAESSRFLGELRSAFCSILNVCGTTYPLPMPVLNTYLLAHVPVQSHPEMLHWSLAKTSTRIGCRPWQICPMSTKHFPACRFHFGQVWVVKWNWPPVHNTRQTNGPQLNHPRPQSKNKNCQHGKCNGNVI